MENDFSENSSIVDLPPEQEGGEKKGSGFWRFLLDILETVVLSVLLFLAINTISARIRVDGFSMEPTLRNGEFVIVNKLAYQFGKPGTGDVIVFHYPRDPEQEYIKRVIGLAGDKVKIAGGQVLVNGKLIDEPYIAAPPRYESEWEVPQDSLFVLGDNRNNSSDSHNWGPVPMQNVIGKALFVYWPPEQWGLIEHPIAASAAP
jgi:signal peptidase I